MGARKVMGLRYDSFSLSRRARHRSASSSAALSRATPTLNSRWAPRTHARRVRQRGSFSARLLMATPRLNSIWATRTCARRAQLRGRFGSRFLFDYVSAEGMAVRGKYAHNRNRTCPTCMAVNNATLVHIGENREFGDTAPRRGELILSDLCGQFPALVEDHIYIFFHRYLLSFSVCCMLKRKSDAEEALKVLIKYHALHCSLAQYIRTDQGDEFGGSNETFSHSGGN